MTARNAASEHFRGAAKPRPEPSGPAACASSLGIGARLALLLACALALPSASRSSEAVEFPEGEPPLVEPIVPIAPPLEPAAALAPPMPGEDALAAAGETPAPAPTPKAAPLEALKAGQESVAKAAESGGVGRESRALDDVFDGAAMAQVRAGRELALTVLDKNTYEVRLPGTSLDRTIVTAGSQHFNDLWTRDACFALMGLLDDPKRASAARGVLQSLFDRVDARGQLPRRQGDHPHNVVWSWFLSLFGAGLPSPRALSRFEYADGLRAPQYDAAALALILAEKYLRASGDLEFARQNYAAMSRSAAWLEAAAGSSPDKLIDQPGGADWKDGVKRSGKVAYTNVVVFKAFDSLAGISRALGDGAASERYHDLAEAIKASINGDLWDERRGYYKDSDGITAFSPDGNILAVLWGLADAGRSDRIMTALQKAFEQGRLPYPALVGGKYPPQSVPWLAKRVGVEHYHDTFIWPWQANLAAVAAERSGRPGLARRLLRRVAAQAVADGTFYEVYSPRGAPRPVRSFFYRSEPDFLWSAGTYLWAFNEILGARCGEQDCPAKP
ncbi:MAG: hypothetical protein KGJ45_09765 [Elusimicrobia bacterium]|nr:hypothetical protein [Elusimicrobiota bacterium]